MLICGFSLCLLNFNIFPKMALFHIEMLSVTNFSGIHISSVDTCFFLFQWLWATLWRKVCVIIYYFPFNPCVKALRNLLAEVSEIVAVILLKVHPFSVFPSCNCTLLRYSACCTLWVHWEMFCLVTGWAEYGKALIPLTLSGKALCVCAHPHTSAPFPFHISRADFTSQTENTSSHLQPAWLFSLLHLIFQWKLLLRSFFSQFWCPLTAPESQHSRIAQWHSSDRCVGGGNGHVLRIRSQGLFKYPSPSFLEVLWMLFG